MFADLQPDIRALDGGSSFPVAAVLIIAACVVLLAALRVLWVALKVRRTLKPLLEALAVGIHHEDLDRRLLAHRKTIVGLRVRWIPGDRQLRKLAHGIVGFVVGVRMRALHQRTRTLGEAFTASTEFESRIDASRARVRQSPEWNARH